MAVHETSIEKMEQTTLDLVKETGPLKLISCGLTHRGLVRPSNEDQFLVADLAKSMRIRQSSLAQAPTKFGDDEGHILLVADGIGGGNGGAEASAMAVVSIEEFLLNTLKWFFKLQGPEKDNVVAELQSAFRQADANIFAEAAQHAELSGMGTTLTLAYGVNSDLYIVHVGDSRCYLLRDGNLQLLTRDHTLAQEVLDSGTVASENVNRRFFNMVTNAVGGNRPGVRADVIKLRVASGDALLLCTDGLSHMVPHERIAEILNASSEAKPVCEQLVAEALKEGGRDNVTVIVGYFESNLS